MSIRDKALEMYRGTLFRRYDPDGTVFYFSHEDFEGLKKVPYEFKNQRGETVRGGFYSYDNPDSRRLVVFDHGMGAGGHRAYMREIEMIARRGVTVFSYDHSGCFGSEGKTIYGFGGSIADLDDCLKALKEDERYLNREISVIGHSWGAFSTLNILSRHADVKSIVAMSGFISIKDMQRQVIPFVLAPFRKYLFELEERTNPDYVNHNAIETLKDTDAQVLIIHSTDDRMVNCKRHFIRMQKALSDKRNIRFILEKGKNHSPNYTHGAAKYKDEFFRALSKKKKANELQTEEQRREFIRSFDWYKMTEQDERVWQEIYKTLGI